MTTYNHAFTVAFAVPNCTDADWEDTLKNEPKKVLVALTRRLGELMNDNREFLEALEGFDTYEE
jgi:hypothetical protein